VRFGLLMISVRLLVELFSSSFPFFVVAHAEDMANDSEPNFDFH
jgi:hypothetical protein